MRICLTEMTRFDDSEMTLLHDSKKVGRIECPKTAEAWLGNGGSTCTVHPEFVFLVGVGGMR